MRSWRHLTMGTHRISRVPQGITIHGCNTCCICLMLLAIMIGYHNACSQGFVFSNDHQRHRQKKKSHYFSPMTIRTIRAFYPNCFNHQQHCPFFSSSSSSSSSTLYATSKKSAFGRNRIMTSPHEHRYHLKKSNKLNGTNSSSTTTNSNITITPGTRLKNKKEKIKPPQKIPPIDPVQMQRDCAIMALYQQIQLNTTEASELVDTFPELYLNCPNLATRLFYLTNQLGMSIEKIQHFLHVHPRLFITRVVLHENLEEKIPSTAQILQSELRLSLDEIIDTKLYQVDRMQVKKRIAILRQVFHDNIDDLKKVILKDPGCLSRPSPPSSSSSSSSSSATENVQSSENSTTTSAYYSSSTYNAGVMQFLRDDMRLENEEIANLVRTYPNVVTLSGARLENCRKRWYFVLRGPIGEGLMSVTRRGIDPTNIEDEAEREQVLYQRATEFVTRDFKTLYCDTLYATTEYLVETLGCSIYDLGRIAYRRTQIFEYQPERLQEKVNYFLTRLDLPKGRSGIQSILNIMALTPDIFTQSVDFNLEPKLDYLQYTLGMNQMEIQELVLSKPHVLALGLEANIKRKLDYLANSTKIPLPTIRRIIYEYPRSLQQPFDSNFKRRGDFLLELYPNQPLPCPGEIPLDFLQMHVGVFEQWLLSNFGEDTVLRFKHNKGANRRRRPRKKPKA